MHILQLRGHYDEYYGFDDQMEREDSRVEALTWREHQLVQQVSELERQVQRVPQQVATPQSDTELQSLRVQLQSAEQAAYQLQAQFNNKVIILQIMCPVGLKYV